MLSIDDFKAEIEKNLLECNIVVFVCHKETADSPEVQHEIDFLFTSHNEHKIITFAKCDNCIPNKLLERWHRLHFPPEKPEESFCRLLNEILKCYIQLNPIAS